MGALLAEQGSAVLSPNLLRAKKKLYNHQNAYNLCLKQKKAKTNKQLQQQKPNILISYLISRGMKHFSV